ncbi:hypothetical protein OA525_01280 [Alphaproteobacteria bacterium]|nr:hypothetical protein [Alphaproteobacteria bacterium]
MKFNSVLALTQDISLTIMVKSPLDMEYVLSKSICKVLDRELRISHSFGGSNTLDCQIHFDESVDEIIKKIEQNQFQYAVVKKDDLFNRPSNLAIRSVLHFAADKNYVFITNQNVDSEIIKEINYGILNHLMEFKHLHSSFMNFSEDNLIVKQEIPMHMGTLRFSDEWKNEKKKRFTEVE